MCNNVMQMTYLALALMVPQLTLFRRLDMQKMECVRKQIRLFFQLYRSLFHDELQVNDKTN